jgi:hypothetical protein
MQIARFLMLILAAGAAARADFSYATHKNPAGPPRPAPAIR